MRESIAVEPALPKPVAVPMADCGFIQAAIRLPAIEQGENRKLLFSAVKVFSIVEKGICLKKNIRRRRNDTLLILNFVSRIIHAIFQDYISVAHKLAFESLHFRGKIRRLQQRKKLRHRHTNCVKNVSAPLVKSVHSFISVAQIRRVFPQTVKLHEEPRKPRVVIEPAIIRTALNIVKHYASFRIEQLPQHIRGVLFQAYFKSYRQLIRKTQIPRNKRPHTHPLPTAIVIVPMRVKNVRLLIIIDEVCAVQGTTRQMILLFRGNKVTASLGKFHERRQSECAAPCVHAFARDAVFPLAGMKRRQRQRYLHIRLTFPPDDCNASLLAFKNHEMLRLNLDVRRISPQTLVEIVLMKSVLILGTRNPEPPKVAKHIQSC